MHRSEVPNDQFVEEEEGPSRGHPKRERWGDRSALGRCVPVLDRLRSCYPSQMAMNYLRELLYRPKRSDKSLMARFYFADLNLNAVAQELDSFDGRKDPERCTCLVNKLRSCQDKLLSICNKMLEKVEPGLVARSREFRAKFPGGEQWHCLSFNGGNART